MLSLSNNGQVLLVKREACFLSAGTMPIATVTGVPTMSKTGLNSFLSVPYLFVNILCKQY